MHDIHESTIQAVPGIIAGLKSRGMTFVHTSTLSGDACKNGTARRR
jgi:peptidoglycan/xylan/chitin deacetylase (PgdA/CDA1 family)